MEGHTTAARRMHRSPLAISTTIGLCVGLLISAVLGVRELAREQADAARQSSVEVVSVAPGAVRQELVYAGLVQAPQQLTITALSAGTLTSMGAAVGDTVRAGTRLASLTTESLPAQLLQAQADLVAAEARRALLGAGTRPTDVDSARAILAAAEAKLTRLQQPSATDIALARSVLANAQSTLASSEAAIDTNRALLLGAIANACSVPFGPAIPIPCGGTDVPLAPDLVDTLGRFFQSRVGDTRTDLGSRAVAVLQANGNYRGSLASVEATRLAQVSASAKLDALLNPTAVDLTAQRAQVQVARDTLENKLNPYTDADIQAANAVVARAAAQIATIEASLARTSITAPFDGVIAQRLVEVGANVTPSTPLFVLVGKGAQVHVTLRDTDAASIKPGFRAEVSTEDAPTPITGRVARIAPFGDARSHTVDVEISTEDQSRPLRPGTLAQVRIITVEKPDVLSIPSTALVLEDRVTRVFVVADGRARSRDVTVGIVSRGSAEITAGLRPGEVVIVRGQSTLRDRQAVRAAPAAK